MSGESEPEELLRRPSTIRKLDEETVNKIAAHEIIVRPSNAVKGMS